MVRRNFFIKLGAVFGAVVASSSALGNVGGQIDVAEENVYRCKISRPGSFTNLSAAERKELKDLKQSFRQSGKLLSIVNTLDESSPSIGQNTNLIVVKTFNSKESRDAYVSVFEGIINKTV